MKLNEKEVIIALGVCLVLIISAIWIAASITPLPDEIVVVDDLKWLPSDASRDLERFTIDTRKEVIKYYYLEAPSEETLILVHPLKSDYPYLELYNVDFKGISSDGKLVIRLIPNQLFVFVVFLFIAFLMLLGSLGIMTVIIKT